MMESSGRVCIYIFDIHDARSPGQRLLKAVSEYCGEDVQGELHVERTHKGKPYFPDLPGIQFSISHSGGYWACTVAEESVGLDLQEYALLKGETPDKAAVRFSKLAHRFFHPLEAEFVEWDRFHNFFTAWAAKEAYVKYTGQGIDKYFSEHCVIPGQKTEWNRLSGKREGVAWRALEKQFWKSYYKEDYILCVCTSKMGKYSVIDYSKS